jgi:hypothetical protein
MTPLSMVTADHFHKVQQATARKLIDTAVARTGSAAGDWVVRPFVMDGGTGPTSTGVETLKTPDLTMTEAVDVADSQLGWDISVAGATEPSVAWATLNADTTVPDMTFYGFFGHWEACSGGGNVTDSSNEPTQESMRYAPMIQAWNLTSGAQVLDIMFTESQAFSMAAQGGITNSPVIFTQNSNIQLKYWLADTDRTGGVYASGLHSDHPAGLFGLTCERAGETLAEPGIHTYIPLGLAGSGAFLNAMQNEAAQNLIAMASKETNSPASDWLVREFSLDDDSVGPLTKMDLTSDATLYGALCSGWQVDADALSASTFTTILSDTSVPDNTFFALIGGFEAPHGAAKDVDEDVAHSMTAAWGISKGASTVGFYPIQDVGAWQDNWGFVVNQPLYFKQNETMNIRHLRSASTTVNGLDTTLGLNILVCERVGENISAAKMSN